MRLSTAGRRGVAFNAWGIAEPAPAVYGLGSDRYCRRDSRRLFDGVRVGAPTKIVDNAQKRPGISVI